MTDMGASRNGGRWPKGDRPLLSADVLNQPIALVASIDDGASWRDAELNRFSQDRFAWINWRAVWRNATPGEHILVCRATDSAGNVQPLDPNDRWNRQGMGGNVVERIPVRVQAGIGRAGTRVPSPAQIIIPGARGAPVPSTTNPLA